MVNKNYYFIDSFTINVVITFTMEFKLAFTHS